MKFILTAILLALPGLTTAATVLSNIPSAVLSNNIVKGTGGFIPTPVEYGFEFTAGPVDHQLVTITLSIGNHFGTLPLTVELYGSPSGPDAAVFLTDLTGPSQPASQLATYAPVLPTTLSAGASYFVRMWVNGNASSYTVERTATPATGDFAMGNYFTRTGGGLWGAGSHDSETMAEIAATPVPEPAAITLSCAGFLLMLRRRRW